MASAKWFEWSQVFSLSKVNWDKEIGSDSGEPYQALFFLLVEVGNALRHVMDSEKIALANFQPMPVDISNWL